MNGLVELAPISTIDERDYADVIGRHPDLTLRFSTSVTRPMPRSLAILRKVLGAVFLPLAASDPEAADLELSLEWHPTESRGWAISIARTDDPHWHPGSFGKISGDLAGWTVAKGQLAPALRLIEGDWLAHRKALWLSLRSVEHLANQSLSLHLIDSEDRLDEALDAYIGDQSLIGKSLIGPDGISSALATIKNDRARSARFASLVNALVKLRERRDSLELGTLLQQKSVLQSAAQAAALVPLALASGLSPSVPKVLDDLRELAGDAGARAQSALLDYFAEMRRQAQAHPILVVIHHITTRSMTESDIQRALIKAVEQVNTANSSISAVMESDVIPPLLRKATNRETAPGLMAISTAIEKASPLSIWKLPFFFDAALELLPKDERTPISAMRTTALERSEESLLARELVLATLETATMFLPQARAATVALSLGLGLMRLVGAIRTYDEATTLYHASLDPGFLALGVEGHQPADADLIVFDLLAMVLDAAVLGKAAGGR